MAITALRWSDYPVVPWKNGAGVTREIAGHPAGAGPDGFDWRVSVADVSGSLKFSTFPGVDRVVVPLDTAVMALTVDGKEHRLRHREPFAFSGDSTTSCVVGGPPTRDLNVMTRRGRYRSEVVVYGPGEREVAGAGAETTLVVRLDDLTTTVLGADDRLRAAAESDVAVIRISPAQRV